MLSDFAYCFFQSKCELSLHCQTSTAAIMQKIADRFANLSVFFFFSIQAILYDFKILAYETAEHVKFNARLRESELKSTIEKPKIERSELNE
ncbi:hypothetical protein IEQ34_005009 [Dendrobium chrysotoxum]|uniref:Uncharacterized protein n=1 Tax=Dendrobium chrysotoxum TaxID=161865 RepID=A0AAV7H7P2_DENCH|nr:hypothetical protein IEQ34_005009 [Dendrobium chrysotoxum]